MNEYEISIWEDISSSSPSGTSFREKKIAIIGSDKLTSSCRAVNPQLIRNINGTHTFTFKMYYYCQKEDLIDSVSADPIYGPNGYVNPFISYLTNERKVKVKWGNKWYDLIIKEIQEDSSGKVITYTCTDTYINELSKTGFNLVFDNELMNNSGTAFELANKILGSDTDWTVDQEESDRLYEEREETGYQCNVSNSIMATEDKTGDNIVISSNDSVVIYYSQIIELLNSEETSGSKIFQFGLVNNNSSSETGWQGIPLIDVTSCTSTNELSWSINGTVVTIAGISIDISSSSSINALCRAKRLVNSLKMEYDELTQRYCTVYNDGDIYGYEDTNIDDAVAVVNVITNSKDFTNEAAGWIFEDLPEVKLYPELDSVSNVDMYEAKGYLKIEYSSNNTNYNSGLTYCGSYLPDGLQKGTKYVLRFKARTDNNGKPGDTYYSGNLSCFIGEYTEENKVKKPKSGETSIINFSTWQADSDNWRYSIAEVERSYSKNQLDEGALGFFINTPSGGKIWLEEIQFFKWVPAQPISTGNQQQNVVEDFIRPDQFATLSLVKKRYSYYRKGVFSSKKDIEFSYQGFEKSSQFTPVYNNFSKIRTISGSKSNKFNLLQTLAEQFECWIQFKINHNPDGSIIDKKIVFKTEIGEEVPYGFVYGIDLKTIKRTVKSDSIVTKTIVLPNNNEFAKYGSCNISRSMFNPARNTVIFNFDYYISKGMLDKDFLLNALYGSNGYYPSLSNLYISYDAESEKLNKLKSEELRTNSYYYTIKTAKDSALELISSYKSRISSLLGREFNGSLEEIGPLMQKYSDPRTPNPTALKLLEGWQTVANKGSEYDDKLREIEEAKAKIDSEIATCEENIEGYKNSIKTKEEEFSKTFSRFIQEGTWQDESYVDDDLYYLDGAAIASRSAVPQVDYDISVFRISALEEYKDKTFNLGDRTFVYDKEFFGAITGDLNIPVPVTITEITYYFDEPEKDSFKVRNYKDAFDDLFQRITASVQSLKLVEGTYARAANAVLPSQTFNQDILLNSIRNNLQLTMNAVNNTVVQDLNGITVSSIDDPAKQVRINAMGIFISNTGGESWKKAIGNEGIFTEELTEGLIDINKIPIYQGDHPLFRWDQKGINAYPFKEYTGIEEKSVYGVALITGQSVSVYPYNEEEPITIRDSSRSWFFSKYQLSKIIKKEEDTGSEEFWIGYINYTPSNYSNQQTYEINSLCTYPAGSGDRYSCIEEITIPEEWTPSHWRTDPALLSIDKTYHNNFTWTKSKSINESNNTVTYTIRIFQDEVQKFKGITATITNEGTPEEEIQWGNTPKYSTEFPYSFTAINPNTFVRFDRFGLYGLNSNSEEQWDPDSEEDVWDHAQFGLTWKGFFLKKKDNDNGNRVVLEMSSENDFAISEDINEQKIYSIDLLSDITAKKVDDESDTTFHTRDGIFIPTKQILNLFYETNTEGNQEIIFAYVAPYSDTKTYNIDDICVKKTNDVWVFYKCIQQITTAETWTLSHWEELSSIVITQDFCYKITLDWTRTKDSNLDKIDFKINDVTVFTIINYDVDEENITPIYNEYKVEMTNFIERIKIGKFYEEIADEREERYGILIRNKNDEVVMETDDEGNLYLNGTIRATDGYIGKWIIKDGCLSIGTETVGQNDVINANGQFIVKSDGEITATKGSIANFSFRNGSLQSPPYDASLFNTETSYIQFYTVGTDPRVPLFLAGYGLILPNGSIRQKGLFQISKSGEVNFTKMIGIPYWSDTTQTVATQNPMIRTVGLEALTAVNVANTWLTGPIQISGLPQAGGIFYGQFIGIVNNISDKKMKKDIKNIDSIYENIFNDLRPITYSFKNDEKNKEHIGFIAQEIDSILKENSLNDSGIVSIANSEDKDNAFYTLSYTDFIPLNTWQIQLLKKRVAALEEKIAQLESK